MPYHTKKKRNKLKFFLKTSTIGFISFCCVSYYVIKDIQSQLPPVAVLKDIQLQTPLRIFSADNKLMAEFGEKRRIPVELEEVPKHLINAVIATEDNRFFEHAGVDVIGLTRAAVLLVLKGTKSQGGSTITMQVARNFFLSRKKTYSRKLNEIFLAMKIEEELTKEEILSLYLNKIFLGHRAYGVAAAAKTYYGKELRELTLAECAMIAGLPKAPSAINPLTNSNAAMKRRNHVLSRMLNYNYITEQEYHEAISSPITATKHDVEVELHAPYVNEMVRHALIKRWGDDIYTAGLQIYTTIDSRLQEHANTATRNAINKYEQRHGYRGPIANWGQPSTDILEEWLEKLNTMPKIGDQETAVVLTVNDKKDFDNSDVIENMEPQNNTNNINVLTKNREIINLDWSAISWARKKNIQTNTLDKKPKYASEVLQPGDVIQIWQDPDYQNKWVLTQVPEIEGSLISLDPNNGQIRALTGGYDYFKSKFNRVTQAYRQAGSSLKPFIYSAALEKGFTPASIFNDAPIVINDPEQEALWRPQNSNKKFYGPTRLRTALIKSRNLVSIRLLQSIGIDYTHEFLQKFGFKPEQIPSTLSLALGTASVTPLQLAQAYSSFANGGYAVNPILIKKITNGNDQVLYELKEDKLENYNSDMDFEYYEKQNQISNFKQIIPPQNAYLINNMLIDAIKNGTGRKALSLKRKDIAGKTGTSSDNFDAWYCGFNRNLVTVTWMGFDQPKSIYEYASTTALPMWIDYMQDALKGKPEQFLPMPNGLVSVRINPQNGLLADSKQKDSIFEIFVSGTEPKKIADLDNQIFTSNNYTNSNDSSSIMAAEQIF